MALSDVEVGLVTLTDGDLVRRVHELVDDLAALDGGELSDPLSAHLAEAFERFVPEAEWADLERRVAVSIGSDEAEAERAAVRGALEERAAARRLLREGLA
jgi:hypothetical protein